MELDGSFQPQHGVRFPANDLAELVSWPEICARSAGSDQARSIPGEP